MGKRVINKKIIVCLLLAFCLIYPRPVSANADITTAQATSIINILIDKAVKFLTASSSTYIYPVDGPISSPFGPRASSPNGFHHGIDIACVENTQVKNSMGGVVVRAEFSESIGNFIEVNHPNGMQTMYAHNNKLLVKVGDKVDKGSIIALSGNTGSLSHGPHVHFEIRTNNGTVSVNPADYLPPKNK